MLSRTTGFMFEIAASLRLVFLVIAGALTAFFWILLRGEGAWFERARGAFTAMYAPWILAWPRLGQPVRLRRRSA